MEISVMAEAMTLTCSTRSGQEALTGGASMNLIEEAAERWKVNTVVTWRKSTYSGGNGGDCVEVGQQAYSGAGT